MLLYRIAILATAAFHTAALKSPPLTRKLYVFGDAHSDNSNRYCLTLGMNPRAPWWDGRFSNGPVWNEYTADLLGVLLENHAFGGATTNNTIIAPFIGTGMRQLPSLDDQITSFLALNAIWKHSEYIGESYVAVCIGSSDIDKMIKRHPTGNYPIKMFAAGLNIAIYDQLERLRDFGFRKFVVFTPVAHDIMPSTKNKDRRLYRTTINAFRKHVFPMAKQFSEQQGVKWVYLFDFDRFMGLTMKPRVAETIGVKHPRDVACYVFNEAPPLNLSAPSRKVPEIHNIFAPPKGFIKDNQYDYYYFDKTHLGARAHRALGYAVAEAVRASEDGDNFLLNENILMTLFTEFGLKRDVELPIE